MKYTPGKNPFIQLFEVQYDRLRGNDDFGLVTPTIENLLKIDEQDSINAFAMDLGNAWTLYGKKLAGGATSLGAVVLKWDGDAEEPFVPTIVLADAYASYSIGELSAQSGSPLLPDSPSSPIYPKVTYGEKVFDEYGGFDLDMVTGYLYDLADDDEVQGLPVYEEVKALFMIKTLDLVYSAIVHSVRGDRFRALNKKMPFAFFALTGKDQPPVLLLEIESV
jgi:hypothetical protein